MQSAHRGNEANCAVLLEEVSAEAPKLGHIVKDVER